MSPTVLYSEETGLGLGDPDFALEGTNYSVPRGVEAQFEYNGLLMNDRTVIDKYRIISIDGLDDPDVRDSRDDNPGSHGETPNFSLYGGRTIAINGRIEAYTLAKLRDMQQALRTAFLDIDRELPLNFLTGSSETDHYINCKKFSKNQWGEEQRDKHVFFRDFVITLRASDPRFYGRESITTTVFPNLIANSSFEQGNILNWGISQTGGWSASAASGASGSSSDWSSEGEQSWLLNYKKNPNSSQQTLLFLPNSFAVDGSATYQFAVDTNILDNPTSGIRPVILFYTAGLALASAASGAVYTGAGEHTFNLEITSPSNAAIAVPVILFTSSTPNDHAWFYVDNFWFSKTGETSDRGRVKITNRGNFESFVTFRFYGQLSSATITNEENDLTLCIKETTTISDGDFYEINTGRKSILDSGGISRFSALDPDSDWIIIESGDNWLRLANATKGGTTNSRIEILTRNAWL